MTGFNRMYMIFRKKCVVVSNYEVLFTPSLWLMILFALDHVVGYLCNWNIFVMAIANEFAWSMLDVTVKLCQTE